MEPYFLLKGNIATATAHGAGPWNPRMLHGGAPAGLIARIVSDLPTSAPMRVARLTIDLQRPVPIGELTIEARVTREGRNIQACEVTLSAEGKPVVRASALKIREDNTKLPDDVALPSVAALPAEGASRPLHREGFNRGLVIRETEPPPTARRAAWFYVERPFFSDRETTPLVRAAATGDFSNGIGSALDFKRWTFINADLTLHFARDPVGEWIMLAANSWIGPDGRGLAFGELADEQGYFGRAVQSLVIAKRAG